MKAKSIKGKSTEEIQEAFEKSMADGFKPTLAFVFISYNQDRRTISSMLDQRGISIFGATTVGEYTEEGVDSGSIVILLLDLNPKYFRITIQDYKEGEARESGRYVGNFGKELFEKAAFIISGSNMEAPGELIMCGILDEVNEKSTVIGGMAGDFVFNNHQESRQGVLALILDETQVKLVGEAVSGWKAVGTEKTITECEGPWIHTIDGQPAMEVVNKFTGIELNDPFRDDGYSHVGTTFPIQIQQEKGAPVMRPLLKFKPEDGSIMCGGNVLKGSRFRFSLPPDFEVVDSVINSAREIRENELSDADAVLIFSCIGRKVSLGPMASSEVLGIQEVWGKPMAGFFSMGEFGKTKNGNTQFHGTTISWVALKEI
jgi:hypothetical protein